MKDLHTGFQQKAPFPIEIEKQYYSWKERAGRSVSNPVLPEAEEPVFDHFWQNRKTGFNPLQNRFSKLPLNLKNAKKNQQKTTLKGF